MMKNIFLLLAALLTSYTVMYLSEKLFKGNRPKVFSKALAVIFAVAAIAVAAIAVAAIAVAATGTLPAAGLVFTMGPLPLKVAVLIFSLFAAAYFCYYPLSSKRALRVCIVLIPVLSTFCIYGFYQSFNQDNSLISFYMYLSLGLAAGFGLAFLLNIYGKNRMLYGQSLAFLLASYSIYFSMESGWNNGPDTINSQPLTTQPDTILWTALVLIFISFTCGLFFKSKNKTSC